MFRPFLFLEFALLKMHLQFFLAFDLVACVNIQQLRSARSTVHEVPLKINTPMSEKDPYDQEAKRKEIDEAKASVALMGGHTSNTAVDEDDWDSG
jgi:hypothetical protein